MPRLPRLTELRSVAIGGQGLRHIRGLIGDVGSVFDAVHSVIAGYLLPTWAGAVRSAGRGTRRRVASGRRLPGVGPGASGQKEYQQRGE